ncbi:MAG: hypothetical protein LBQ06_04470 [Frankiaceae bacterium]|jgi:hypothetical protein|nr:hypothetical protein [Frankiaceae bacterium]
MRYYDRWMEDEPAYQLAQRDRRIDRLTARGCLLVVVALFAGLAMLLGHNRGSDPPPQPTPAGASCSSPYYSPPSYYRPASC